MIAAGFHPRPLQSARARLIRETAPRLLYVFRIHCCAWSSGTRLVSAAVLVRLLSCSVATQKWRLTPD